MTDERLSIREELWKEITNDYRCLLEYLPSKILSKPLTENEINLPLLTQSIKVGLKYRTVNLAKTAITLFEEDELLSAIIITRSICETVSLLFWIYQELGKTVTDRELGTIDKFLKEVGFGGKSKFKSKFPDGEMVESRQILNAIDELDKQAKGTRELYNYLSEYVHPNFHGVLVSFSETKGPRIEFSLDYPNDEAKEHALRLLAICLGVFLICEKEIDKLLPDFKKLCIEEGILK